MSTPAGLLFIDVSSLQDEIDWAAVAAWRAPDGRRIVGVIARATNGTSEDSRFDAYRRCARAAGLRFGAYGVIYPSGDVEAQARAFLAVVGSIEDDELPQVLDWEVHGPHEHDAAVRWVAIVDAATGRRSVIYTGLGFTSAIEWPTNSPLLTHELWVAHYTSAEHPLVPSQWRGRFAEWQFSGNGGDRVAGIATDVDRDVFVEDANGDGRLDEADLAAFIEQSFIVPRASRVGPVEVPRAEAIDAPLTASLLSEA
jgi:lysozyme